MIKLNGQEIKYDKFFVCNIGKLKPKNISYSDYGRFNDMIRYMSSNNLLIFPILQDILKITINYP